MLRLPLLCWLLVLSLPGSSPPASGKTANEPLDVRERLLASFKRRDKDFLPDACLMTHFSYLGRLSTASGRIYVCEARWVLRGMAAPRGFAFIVFCDRHLRCLGKIQCEGSGPLRCEQGRLYLNGDIDVPPDPGWSRCPELPEQQRSGNVIDVSKGFGAVRIYHKKVYGGSGGIHDD